MGMGITWHVLILLFYFVVLTEYLELLPQSSYIHIPISYTAGDQGGQGQYLASFSSFFSHLLILIECFRFFPWTDIAVSIFLTITWQVFAHFFPSLILIKSLDLVPE